VNAAVNERLASFNIDLAAEARDYCLFVRGNCMALSYGGSLSSSGMMTENGLAYLVTRGEQHFLVCKAGETVATPDQVETIRRFSEDLAAALAPYGR
jgi:hypothetical protein